MERLFRASALSLFVAALAYSQTPQWTEKLANDWYARQPWLVGSNYIPATAINQLEMWQADTFDPIRIEMELSWAENIGMNTMRVFLHDIAWQQDPSGMRRRMEKFLSIAKKHHIRPIFVLFDSCWNPFPDLGIQRLPRPGVHNSGWVQSPGARVLADPAQYTRALTYVQEVILAFSTDDRVLAWDVWNEPDNTNTSSYGPSEPKNKLDLVRTLLPRVFEFARAGLPTQPLTSGVWKGDWSSPDKLTDIEKIQIELSDIVSFHSYAGPEEFEKRIQWLQAFHRPVLCTEYMARPLGSTVQAILPIAKKYNVAAYNWGFAAGKTQTYLPWDSWQHPYPPGKPQVWFHDLYTPEGRPFQAEEVEFIHETIGRRAKGKTTTAGR